MSSALHALTKNAQEVAALIRDKKISKRPGRVEIRLAWVLKSNRRVKEKQKEFLDIPTASMKSVGMNHQASRQHVYSIEVGTACGGDRLHWSA